MITIAAGRRSTRSFRTWDGTWEDLKQAAEGTGTPPTTLLGDALEAILGYIRCSRCSSPIPVGYGNLTGMNLLAAIADAVRAVQSQRCWAYEGVNKAKRPAHHPVTIGAPEAGQPPAASGEREEEPTREEGDAQDRTEPPPHVPVKARKAPRKPEPEPAPPAAASPDLEALIARLVEQQVTAALQDRNGHAGEGSGLPAAPAPDASAALAAVRERAQDLGAPLAPASALTAERRPGTAVFKPAEADAPVLPVREVPVPVDHTGKAAVVAHAPNCKCGICKPARRKVP